MLTTYDCVLLVRVVEHAKVTVEKRVVVEHCFLVWVAASSWIEYKRLGVLNTERLLDSDGHRCSKDLEEVSTHLYGGRDTGGVSFSRGPLLLGARRGSGAHTCSRVSLTDIQGNA